MVEDYQSLSADRDQSTDVQELIESKWTQEELDTQKARSFVRLRPRREMGGDEEGGERR